MYEDFIQKGLIEPYIIHELGEHDPKQKWYNKNVYYLYHQLKGHKTNGCISLRKNLQKVIDNSKINYDPNDSDDYYQDDSSKDDLQVNNISATIPKENPPTISYPENDQDEVIIFKFI